MAVLSIEQHGWTSPIAIPLILISLKFHIHLYIAGFCVPLLHRIFPRHYGVFFPKNWHMSS